MTVNHDNTIAGLITHLADTTRATTDLGSVRELMNPRTLTEGRDIRVKLILCFLPCLSHGSDIVQDSLDVKRKSTRIFNPLVVYWHSPIRPLRYWIQPRKLPDHTLGSVAGVA